MASANGLRRGETGCNLYLPSAAFFASLQHQAVLIKNCGKLCSEGNANLPAR
jgi:hypothetical protein